MPLTKEQLNTKLAALYPDAPWESQDEPIKELLQDLINAVFELSEEQGSLTINNVGNGGGLIAKHVAQNTLEETVFSITKNSDTEVRHQALGDVSFFTGGQNGTEKLRIKSEGTVVTNSLKVSQNNVPGGGIILANKGDIVDLGDGYCSVRFNEGVQVFSANGGGSPVITLAKNGNITASGDITAFSDARLKTNIRPLENALEKVMALKGVSYTRTDQDEARTQIGFIAQQVKDVLPEVVQYNATSNVHSLDYGKMVAVLVESTKKQQELINSQQQQIHSQQNKIHELAEELRNIKNNIMS